MERNANRTSLGQIRVCRQTHGTPYAEQTSGNGNSTDARLADYSTATRWHRRYIIHQYESRWSSSRNTKLDAYPRRSENRPGKGGIRITRSRRSGMHSMLRQLWSALTPKALYSRHREKNICVATRRCVSNIGSVETYCRKQFTVKTHSTHRCSLYAESPFERYILRVVRYPRKVPSQLPFERYVRHGVYYPRKVPSQLPFERYVWHGIHYPHNVPS